MFHGKQFGEIMQKIKKIIGYIDDELRDAEKYLNCATAAKADGDTSIYETALRLSQAEITHASDWHTILLVIADKAKMGYNNEENMAYKLMMDYFNDAHQDYVDKVARLKYMIDIIKS